MKTQAKSLLNFQLSSQNQHDYKHFRVGALDLITVSTWTLMNLSLFVRRTTLYALSSFFMVAAYFSFGSPTAAADFRYIYGVPIPVDNSSDLDNNLVQVTVCGATSIVGKEAVASKVLESCLVHHAPKELPHLSNLSPVHLKKLLVGVIGDGREDLGSRLLLAIVLSKNGEASFKSEALSTVVKAKSSISIASRFLHEAQGWDIPSDILSPLLIHVWVNDGVAAREKILLQRASLSSSLRTSIEEEFFSELLKGNSEKARAIHELFGLLFPEQPERILGLAGYLGKVRGIQKGKAVVDEAISLYQSSPEFKPSLKKLLPAVAISHLQRLAASGAYDQELEFLGRFPFEARTAELHNYFRNALIKTAEKPSSLVLSPMLRRALVSYSAVDEGIRREAGRLLRKRIEELVSSHDYRGAILYLDALREVNPDPSIINDQIRSLYADAAIRNRSEFVAHPSFEEVRNLLPFGQRMRMWLLEFWVGIPSFVLAACLVFAGLFLWFFGFYRARQFDDSADDEPLQSPRVERFVASSNVPRPEVNHAGLKEYVQCLQILDLESDADLAEAKAAFRRVMKEEHPDMVRDSESSIASDRFLNVKHAYERLIELDKDPVIKALRQGRVV
jgi:tetratricopeptide (TPR) repeat protein